MMLCLVIIVLLLLSLASVKSQKYESIVKEYNKEKKVFKSLFFKNEIFHSVVFAIKQNNIDYLESVLLKTSDPTSEFYGHHMTREEISVITVNKNSTESVISYLRKSGIEIIRQTPYGEFVTCKGSITQWEHLFSTTFYQVILPERIQTTILLHRAKTYTIPTEIISFVSVVFNTVQIPPEMNSKRFQMTKVVPDSGSPKRTNYDDKKEPTLLSSKTTPSLLNKFYNIDSNIGHANVSQSVFESMGQFYSQDDLQIFQGKCNISLSKVAHNIGLHESSHYCNFLPYQCAEANLDVQYMMAISQVTPTTVWYEQPFQDDIFLSWIISVSTSLDIPLVHSISYGAYEKSVSISYARAFNIEALKLGLLGVTIVASSGIILHSV